MRRRHPILAFLLRWTFGIIFIAAAWDKILHPADFAQNIENYRIVGPFFSRWLAISLPYLEVLLGLSLISGIWLDAARVLTPLLMAVFMGVVTYAYLHDLQIDCGCFSQSSDGTIDILTLIRNLILLSAALMLYGATGPRRRR